MTVQSRVQRLDRRSRRVARRLTAGARALPDFVIIGAQKAGSSSLLDLLLQHPSIRPIPNVPRAELNFFDERWSRGLWWYRSYFPFRWPHPQQPRGWLTGEKTPEYLFHPLAAERARVTIPHARFIAVLREPVARAASQHQMNLRLGWESLDLAEAVAAEDSRTGDAFTHLTNGTPGGEAAERYSYVARGRYAEQLDRWQWANDRHQLLILRTEDLATDPQSTLNQCCDFLGLPTIHTEAVHTNQAPDRYEIDADAQALLEENLDQANHDLADRYHISW